MVLCAVEAFDKDHAVRRLVEKYPYTIPREWEYLDDLDPEHFCGALGDDLPMPKHEIFSKKSTIVS